jgi:hypothetical protein
MLETYRREFADFNSASTREYYLYFSGQKPRYEISEIYSRYSDLFSIDAIERLKKERDEIDKYYETDRGALSRLLAFAYENYLALKVKELTEEIANLEGSSTIEWDGKTVPFHEITPLLISEQNHERRLRLYRHLIRLIDSINDLRAERMEKLQESAAKLGFENYLQIYSQLYQVDYVALDNQMQRFLADTEKVYITYLDRLLRRNLGLSLAEADRADTFHFLHLRNFDNLFPGERLLLAYRETMEGLGIRIDRQSNIEIDSVSRPNKHSRAFCAPVVIPEEIKLVLKPMGGLHDYEVFFHEAGHAQHFGFTAHDLRPEFKYTGDYGLTEAYAFLFNFLVSDPDWLSYMLGDRELGDLPAAGLLTRLYSIRRHAAKLHYEIELYGSTSPAKTADLYEEHLTAATKFQYNRAEYLFDLDEGLYVANYLRAWMLEVMLRDYLLTRYGRKWWNNKKAGDLLKELWNTGNRYTADELAAQIGLGPLIVEPLEAEFLTKLKF